MAVVCVHHTCMLSGCVAEVLSCRGRSSADSAAASDRAEKAARRLARACVCSFALSFSVGLKARRGKWFVLVRNRAESPTRDGKEVVRFVVILFKNVAYFMMHQPPDPSFLPSFLSSAAFKYQGCECGYTRQSKVLITKIYGSESSVREQT